MKASTMKIWMIAAIAAIAASLFASPAGAQSRQPQPEAPTPPGMDMSHAHQDQSPHAESAPAPDSIPDLLKDVVTRPPIALADFLNFADQANPTLRQAKNLVQRSEAQARQAALYPNPSVGYQGEQIRGGEYGSGEQGGFVQQTIVLGGKLGLRREIYKQQSLSDKIGVEEQTSRVHNDVAQAFYDALAAQAAVMLRRRLLSVATDAVETVHQLGNVGQADAPDILQTEVEAEQAKVDYGTAQRRFIESFRTLAALAGKPDLPVSPLRGDLEAVPVIDAEERVQEILASSPAIKRAEQEAATAQAKLRDAKRESVPDLELRAGEQSNGEHVASLPAVKAAGAQSFVTAGIQLPLWNRNQGNIDAAKVEVERAQEDVTRMRLSIKELAEPLAQSYLSARYTADQYRTELIPRAERAYQLYLAKYQTMAQAYPQVLVSQRTLFELQIGYLTALHDVWSDAVALQNYALSGGLAAPGAGESGDGRDPRTQFNLPNAGGGRE